MDSSMHRVNFPYTEVEVKTLFRYAHEHDLLEGGRYDAQASAISVYSTHWRNPAMRDESEILGTFYFSGVAYFHHWCGDTTELWDIETEDGFSFEDLMVELRRLELTALRYVKHGMRRGKVGGQANPQTGRAGAKQHMNHRRPTTSGNG